MNPAEFGNYLRSLREKAELSMGKLAKKSGVSQPYISQIEMGNRGIPSVSVLIKLANALGVSSADLISKAGHSITNNHHGGHSIYTTEGLDHDALFQLRQMNRDIINYLKNEPGITYRGQFLTQDERERILKMIELMFPESYFLGKRP